MREVDCMRERERERERENAYDTVYDRYWYYLCTRNLTDKCLRLLDSDEPTHWRLQ